jgi:hypothetical protein
MKLASLLEQYQSAFIDQYAARLLPGHHQAMAAIGRCRTPDSGQMRLTCEDCDYHLKQPHSCGHRSCPRCQNHDTTQWLERQRKKLLPVEYFMVTFTLPYELRAVAWRNQARVYNALFACACSTLKDFAMNDKHLGADLGMTAVLHTHSRRLDYHPHVHVIVPGGAINSAGRQWKKAKGKYLFNAFALARVFRARMLETLSKEGLLLPGKIPQKWVVDCRHVGQGAPALEYLSRYLYRGVMSEKNIIANQHGKVTFRYVDSSSGKTKTRQLKGEDFIWLVLQHVLPKGFRRVRDYGFLHGNAKARLARLQLILQVLIKEKKPRKRPSFICPKCQSPMRIIGFIKPAWKFG